MNLLKSPFPYFGGKSKIADEIWRRFGIVKNYVEPFAGSMAVLLSRPNKTSDTLETVNDIDGYVVNFWRAIKNDPNGLSKIVDYPVSEIDLDIRHEWLVDPERKRKMLEGLTTDAEYYDLKIAGWWCWGICQWIGSGWCTGPANKQLPHLGNNGKGVHKKTLPLDEPCLKWFNFLSQRLRRVRICQGDWERVCSPSATYKLGLTAVFLDPPYSGDRRSVYTEESFLVSKKVNEWCVENGNNSLFRIILSGYDGEHNNLEKIGWKKHSWSAQGGYGNQSELKASENKGKETLWISPHCLSKVVSALF